MRIQTNPQVASVNHQTTRNASLETTLKTTGKKPKSMAKQSIWEKLTTIIEKSFSLKINKLKKALDVENKTEKTHCLSHNEDKRTKIEKLEEALEVSKPLSKLSNKETLDS